MRLLAAFEDKSSGFSELMKIKVLSVEPPKYFLTAEIRHEDHIAIVQQTGSEQNPGLLSSDSVVFSLRLRVTKLCSQAVVLPR